MREQSKWANWLLNESIENLVETAGSGVKKTWVITSDYDFGGFGGKASPAKLKELITGLKSSITKSGAKSVSISDKSTDKEIKLEVSLTLDSAKTFIKALDAVDAKFSFIDGGHNGGVDDTTSGKSVDLSTFNRLVMDHGSDITDEIANKNAKLVKMISEGEESEEEDAVDVDKALKIVKKIAKYAEKLEDEKLEKLVAELNSALGVEDEEEESEEDSEKPAKAKKGADEDFGDL